MIECVSDEVRYENDFIIEISTLLLEQLLDSLDGIELKIVLQEKVDSQASITDSKYSYASPECGITIAKVVKNKGYKFEVVINQGLEWQCFLRTLIHELTHVAQYQRKDLAHVDTSLGESLTYFKNIAYDCDEVKYQDQPWEIEAVNNEIKMLKFLAGWIESNNSNKSNYERTNCDGKYGQA